MPDILSKFIYFTSAKFTAEIVSSAFDKRSEKFNNKEEQEEEKQNEQHES